jgi:PST family polysaccharide transporter
LIANPLLYWFVGRSGPVKTMDFYRLLGPFTAASACALGACLLFRRFIGDVNPIVGFLTCGIIVAITTLLALAVLPQGRKALADIKHSLMLLRPGKPGVIAAASK